jgi:hypothetical protein
MSDEVTMARLKDQIGWYDRRSRSNQSWYKILKITVVAIAALIPLLSGLQLPFPSFGGVPAWVLGALGAAIAVIEGIQQINQYHANWISYRSTCEALKHEKYLYLANAGPYAGTVGPHRLLAERVESLVSQEHAKWASSQKIDDTTSSPAAGKGPG